MTYTGILLLFLLLAANLVSQLLLPTVKQKNTALLICSLLFYGWAGPGYLLLLVGLALVFWWAGRQLRHRSAPGTQKLLVAIPIALAVAALVVFQYGSLILGTTQRLFGAPKVLPELLAPLGISIYTLMLISYLVDVYRGDTAPEAHFLTFLTYASLFHVALGGPALRYRDVKTGLSRRKMHPGYISQGITRFSIGFAKKFILADSLAMVVDQFLPRSTQGLAGVPVTGLWLGVILSAIRLYLTFSAYADMALGLGFMTGLRYGENFDYPFLSTSLRGFLSKWMISVTTFFQDYVRSPITGGGKQRAFAGILLACGLMGLWYGPCWNYLIMGLTAGLWLYLEDRYFSRLGPAAGGVFGVVGILLFFLQFSFTTLGRLGIALKGLIGLNHNGFFGDGFFSMLPGCLPLILVSLLFCLPLGRILHNLLSAKFKHDLNGMTVITVWETVYPILLLAVAVFWILRGSGTPALTF